MAKGSASKADGVGARAGSGTTIAAAIAGIALAACSAGTRTEPTRAATEVPAVVSVAETVEATPVAPRDPDGVPDFGPATACPTATGDARAMRTRLRTIERGREPEPPESASLLEGCGATARDIAEALEKGGRAIARAAAHDHAAAAAYFRRAIEIDPSFTEARLSLAGARAKLGQIDGAFYQLDQIRNAGRSGQRSFARAFSDGNLASLRLQPRFWTWAGDPVPEMAATLPGSSVAPLDSLGASLAFSPEPSIEPDRIFAPFAIEGSHYRVLSPAVNAALGTRISRPHGFARELAASPWVEHLDSLGAVLLTRPSAFRFGGGEVVVAIPFSHGEVGMEQLALLVAKGPESGPFEVVHASVGGGACSTPVAFTSRDRRVLGYFTSCDDGEDPAGFGRCIVYSENGVTTSRCGNGASPGVGGNGSEDYVDEDGLEADESYDDCVD